jgi:hypothetical protein
LKQLLGAVVILGLALTAYKCYRHLDVPYEEARREQLLRQRVPLLPETSLLDDGHVAIVGHTKEWFLDGDRQFAYGYLEEPNPFSEEKRSALIPDEFSWQFAQRNPITGLQIHKGDLTDLDDDFFAGFRRLTHLTIDGRGTKVREEQITQICGLPHLRALRLRSIPMSESQMSLLLGTHDLEVLALREARLLDSDLSLIERQSGLLHLDLRDNSITRVPMSGLGSLKHLDLSNTKVSADVLTQVISRAAELEVLIADKCELSTDVFQAMSNLRHLTFLSLNETNASDADLALLAPCTELKTLKLERTTVSRRSIKVLAAFPNLKIVYLKKCPFSDADERKLRFLKENLVILR